MGEYAVLAAAGAWGVRRLRERFAATCAVLSVPEKSGYTEGGMSVAYRDRVAAFLRARPNEWVSAYTLMEIGGKLAFRTRVSECRCQLGMTIGNKVERDPSGMATSYYMFVPAPGQQALPWQGAA